MTGATAQASAGERRSRDHVVDRWLGDDGPLDGRARFAFYAILLVLGAAPAPATPGTWRSWPW